MSITQRDTTTATPEAGAAVPMEFQAPTLPVANVDRAKAFYERLGWRLDIDFKPTLDPHSSRFKPRGSQTSIQRGPLQGLFLGVDDIEAARDALIRRGVDVSEIWHLEPGKGRMPGVDPQHRSYFSRASFEDPDGNTWVLQEITERLPGRTEMRESGALAQLLFETAKRHGAFGTVAPPHDWWDWYAAYMDARGRGSIAEEAAKAAGRYMAAVKHFVVAAA